MHDDPTAPLKLVVNSEYSGMRVDRFIAGAIERLSRQTVKNLIKTGAVEINGDVCCASKYKLCEGQKISVSVAPNKAAKINAETIPLNITYEDCDIIVVDKPAGLVTHPSPGHTNGTLVNALLAHAGEKLSGLNGITRPGIVHRLDKDTSGLIVIAKNDSAHKGLADQFASHGKDGRMQRVYAALCWGKFDLPYGTINAPLSRSTFNRRKIGVVTADKGRHAVTHYKVKKIYSLSDSESISLLLLQLETGRTHQIRVHMASIRHPILGDKLYGKGFKSSAIKLPESVKSSLDLLNRQALHAISLDFEHPRTGRRLHFKSPLPKEIRNLLNSLSSLSI
ncbi:MAG: Ribosomal large subunit pseudouridine synthase D [Hyphomicrobiaceae bacterium hypho_1]